MRLGQLVFTSLPANESPVKKEGYQVVCWTKNYLSLEDIRDIEKRLIYYISDNGSPVKKQFFYTQTGKVVISETRVIEKTINGSTPDSYKRHKSYFSHCYILENSDFRIVENNPFRLFKSLIFISSINELRTTTDISTQNIDFAIIDQGNSNYSGHLENLHLDDLISIISLAENSIKLAHEKKQIQFIGESDQLVKLLNLVLTLIPSTSRANCTFDTFFEKCNMPLGSYWAVGLKTPIMGSAFISIDLTTGKILSKEWRNLQFSNEYYGNWLKLMLKKSTSIPNLTAKVPTAEYLSELMLGRGTDFFNPDKETVDTFCSIYKNQINNLLYGKLRQLVGATIVDLAYLAITKNSRKTKLGDIEWLIPDRMNASTIVNELISLFNSDLSLSPSKDAVADLRKLASTTKNYVLFCLCKVWQENIDDLNEYLLKMPVSDYLIFSKIVLDREELYPSFLITKGKVTALLGLNFNFEDEDDFIDFIATAINVGEGSSLNPLENRLTSLSRTGLIKIRHLIKRKTIESSFTTRLYKLIDNV